MSVLITEMLRFEVHRKDAETFEGEQHIQHSRAFLLQQALLISHWINKFHTQSVNDYFIESSNGVTDLNWTPPEVIAFQKYAEDQLKDTSLLEGVLSARKEHIMQNMKLRSKSVTTQNKASLAMTHTSGFFNNDSQQ